MILIAGTSVTLALACIEFLLGPAGDFIFGAALYEAEGNILFQIIKRKEAGDLNDCEKNALGLGSLSNDYSDMSLDQIKTQIRQNGELNAKAQGLIDNGIVARTGQTLIQKYGPRYDSYQDFIRYYRTVENETNKAIKNRFSETNCD